jgi:hypothetical protein
LRGGGERRPQNGRHSDHLSACIFIGPQAGPRSHEQEFLSNYDSIFTGNFIERVRGAIPHNMFANAEGIKIADGAVWFDEKGKVKALNN